LAAISALLLSSSPLALAKEEAFAPNKPSVSALSAILIDAVSGQVLYAKSADTQRPPASTTKIMTSILLLENTHPDDVITAGQRASEVTGSSLNLAKGEKVTAADMLYALMLRSANDGCTATAEHIAGSVGNFVALMNAKAREIGCANTHFANPHGLNAKGHLTTARDLATMARYATQYPSFNQATRTKWQKIGRAPENKDNLLKNHAKFLWKFPGADGIKTGFTNPAGKCFVGSATWNGWRLISVVLNSGDPVEDTSALMRYGFKQYLPLAATQLGQVCGTANIKDGREATVEAVASRKLLAVTRKDAPEHVEIRSEIQEMHAPVAQGATVGKVTAYLAGAPVDSAPLLAGKSVELLPVTSAVSRGASGGGWYFVGSLGTAGILYATATSKSARRRRDRLKAGLRGADRGG
jgi:D-alanyl-D-alanine carboxypeptidase (penicillin-binding protein 5/6)